MTSNTRRHKSVRDKGAVGELRFKPEHVLPKSATEYFQQNVWLGASFPTHDDAAAAREVFGIDRFMWGSDYPPRRAHLPPQQAGAAAGLLRLARG